MRDESHDIGCAVTDVGARLDEARTSSSTDGAATREQASSRQARPGRTRPRHAAELRPGCGSWLLRAEVHEVLLGDVGVDTRGRNDAYMLLSTYRNGRVVVLGDAAFDRYDRHAKGPGPDQAVPRRHRTAPRLDVVRPTHAAIPLSGSPIPPTLASTSTPRTGTAVADAADLHAV